MLVAGRLPTFPAVTHEATRQESRSRDLIWEMDPMMPSEQQPCFLDLFPWTTDWTSQKLELYFRDQGE